MGVKRQNCTHQKDFALISKVFLSEVNTVRTKCTAPTLIYILCPQLTMSWVLDGAML